MAQLRQQYDQFVAHNSEIIVVGPEDAEAFAREWAREAYPFIGVPDPDQQIADLYGQEVKLLKLGRMPSMAVIDEEGLVIYRHYGTSMADIPDNQEILALL